MTDCEEVSLNVKCICCVLTALRQDAENVHFNEPICEKLKLLNQEVQVT